MARLTGGEAVVEALQVNGFTALFGIPGTANLAVVDGLRRAPEIRWVVTRHEQGAAYLADGYARASGRPAAVLTVPGPGLTNTLTALGQAYSDSWPILLLTVGHEAALRDKEPFHGLREPLAMTRPVTAWNHRVGSVGEIPEAIAEATRRFRSGRPRPIHLEIPQDVLRASDEVTCRAAEAPAPTRAPDSDVAEAARMLAGARRPAIFAGGGVILAEAGPALRRLAEMLQAPVLVTAQGKGAIPDDHPLALGDGWDRRTAAAQVFPDVDCLLAVGTRFDQLTTRRWTMPVPRTLIHADIDPAVIGQHYPATLELIGDARAVLEQLADALAAMGFRPPDGTWCDPTKVRASRRESLVELAPLAVAALDPLARALPRNAITAHDLNFVSYWAASALPVYEPRTFLNPFGFGTLGFALPAALGAKLACPDRPVVALAGDGGFLYTVHELATAAALRLGVVILLFNDNAWGAIKMEQRENFGGREVGVDLGNPDFVRLAQAFHVRARRLPGPDALEVAVREAFAADGPTLLEVPIPTHAPPWLT